MSVPPLFLEMSTIPFECHPKHVLLREAFYDFSPLGNRITYCPNWEILKGKGGAIKNSPEQRTPTRTTPREPGCTVSPSLDRVGCFLPSSPKAPLSVQHISCVCVSIPALAWEFHKDKARPFYLDLQHLSNARQRDDTKCHQQKQMLV